MSPHKQMVRIRVFLLRVSLDGYSTVEYSEVGNPAVQ